jgi:hypothetical protein
VNPELAAALLNAQAEFEPVPKTATGKVRYKTKDGAEGEYSYKYAPQDQVVAMAQPVLTRNGLVVSQSPTIADGHPALRTLLAHVGGGEIEDVMLTLPKALDPQGQGAGIT